MTSTRRPVLGPLTTPFAIPSSCTVALIQTDTAGSLSSIATVERGFSCTGSYTTCSTKSGQTTTTCARSLLYSAKIDTSCFPSWTAVGMVNGPNEGFYSPGLRCPDGHTTAVSTTFGGQGNWQPIYSLVDGETAVGCCPSSFLFQNDGTSQRCIFTQSSTYYNQVDCYSVFSGNNWYEIPRTITNRGHGAGSVPYAAHVVVRAPIYQLNFQSTDLPSTNSATATTIASTSGSTADRAAETSSDSSTSGASQSLSTGAQAGIGVSVGLAGLALIGAIIFFLLKRRRREQGKNGEPTQWDESKTERSNPTLVGSPPMSELHDLAKFELHGQAKVELHDQAKVEIGGEQRYEIQGQQKFELPA